MNGLRWTSLRPAHLLLACMVLFVVWFSAYSIAAHDAHDTHKADLGQIDLAIWNTAHGRFVQQIKEEAVSTRLTDHVEPIFLPVSLIFWVWNDVRALLILQAAALAAGAWPIYLLARHKLALAGYDAAAEWGGLAITTAYLLTPALQAAAVAEFHALPLAAPLIAWALWTVTRRRWGWFMFASSLLIGVQEGMALLGALLGGYAMVMALRPDRNAGAPVVEARSRWVGAVVGAAMLVLSLGWFYATTFVIIPAHAAQVYDIGQTPYAARYGELGGSFGDVLKSLITRPGLALRIATERLRLRYLFGLFAPTAFLALLGPEILLLSTPLLLANLLSSFPFQYTGTLHYSAPLVTYFAAAAAWGLPRFLRFANKKQNTILINERRLPKWQLASGLIIVAAIAYQISAGYTPVGRVYWRAGGWPEITPHDRLLARFVAQIPPDAALTVTTDLYPHLSHRELIYQFPWVGEATWALVDVSGTTDRHPNDVRGEVDRLISTGWGVVDATDGYLLLALGRGGSSIPDAFYDFARAPAARPQHPIDIKFGTTLQLVGYAVIDDAQWRQTQIRYYWQVSGPVSEDLSISAQVLAVDGAVADDTALRPMPAVVWYPPSRWAVGETIVTETAAWYLPRVWAPVLGVTVAGQMLPASISTTDVDASVVAPDGRVMLMPWERRSGRLAPFVGSRDVVDADARFDSNEWSVSLDGWSAPLAGAPGHDLPVMLAWRANGPAPVDYTVFLHLRTPTGKTVASGDATPSWFVPWPTSHWGRMDGDGPPIWDAHVIALPADLPAGRYDLVVGWYYWETGARLSTGGGGGNATGDEFVLGPVTVDAAAASPPDLPCLIATESCASQ